MDTAVFDRQAELCKALANSKRLELLHLLRNGEHSVAELQRATRMAQTTVSQHLAKLRSVGLVRARHSGTHVLYTLADPRIAQACDLIGAVLASHLEDEGELAGRVNHVADAGERQLAAQSWMTGMTEGTG